MVNKSVLVLYNIIILWVWLYYSRLLYWCMEGYVPIGLVSGSFLFLLLLWGAGNFFWIRRHNMSWKSSLGIILLTLLVMYFEPVLKPIVTKVFDNSAMHMSFRLLHYFQNRK